MRLLLSIFFALSLHHPFRLLSEAALRDLSRRRSGSAGSDARVRCVHRFSAWADALRLGPVDGQMGARARGWRVGRAPGRPKVCNDRVASRSDRRVDSLHADFCHALSRSASGIRRVVTSRSAAVPGAPRSYARFARLDNGRGRVVHLQARRGRSSARTPRIGDAKNGALGAHWRTGGAKERESGEGAVRQQRARAGASGRRVRRVSHVVVSGVVALAPARCGRSVCLHLYSGWGCLRALRRPNPARTRSSPPLWVISWCRVPCCAKSRSLFRCEGLRDRGLVVRATSMQQHNGRLVHPRCLSLFFTFLSPPLADGHVLG